MEQPTTSKKGLGPLAWIGIGCGGIVVLVLIAIVASFVLYGSRFKQFAEDAQKNPTRLTATTMVTMSAGQFEMVAEDDTLKRYTVREKQSGRLTTIYWDEKTRSPQTIPGDFTAIPAASPAVPDSRTEPAPK